MNRKIRVLLCFVMVINMLAGCGDSVQEAATVRIGCMKGPTAIGMILFSPVLIVATSNVNFTPQKGSIKVPSNTITGIPPSHTYRQTL